MHDEILQVHAGSPKPMTSTLLFLEYLYDITVPAGCGIKLKHACTGKGQRPPHCILIMADMAAHQDEDKVGIAPQQWVKMWDEWNTPGGGECEHGTSDSNQHHHHGEGEHECESSGGHGTEVDKYLKKHLNRLTGGKANCTIFVTFCGNSPDPAWLCEQGHSVVGCEISETAVKELFQNKVLGGAIPYEIQDKGEIKIYSATDGKKLQVYVGDFFGSLSPELTGKFDCIWDSHGIVSIPISLHDPFAKKVVKFLKPGGRMFFSTSDYDITKLKTGPAPCPMSTARLGELFPDFDVELLDESEEDPSQMDGLDRFTNPYNLLTPKN